MKTTTKRLLSLLLAAVLICSLFPSGVLEVYANDKGGECGDDLHWMLYEQTGELRITGTGAMDHWDTPDDIPWASDTHKIKKVTVGDSVASIGDFAFTDCGHIKEVSLGSGLRSIGDSAFSDCEGITELTIPKSVVRIGAYAFAGCDSLEKVTISDSISVIREYTFFQCGGLTDVTIPDSVTAIREGAFSQCARLADVTIPDSVTAIGAGAFANCIALTGVTLPDKLTELEEGLFYSCESLVSVTIPKGVTRIGDRAFEDCVSLTGITLPDALRDLGDMAFLGCNGLKSVTLPNRVTAIGDYAFSWCRNLTGITLPAGLTSIGRFSFSHCEALGSVTLPNSLREIGQDAFSDCLALKSVKIPGSVAHMDEFAFGYLRGDVGDGYPSDRLLEFTIYGVEGSAAQTYAQDNDFRFVAVPYDNPFKDVSKDDYYYNPVLWAFYHDPQITTGTDETHFSPENGCTRAQVVTFLWRAAGKPEPSGVNPFKDVPAGEYYTKAVVWAVDNGITTGTDADAFSPNDTCSRAQIVTFLWRSKGKPKPVFSGNPFKDVPQGEYYTDAVLWAVPTVTKGTTPSTFSPEETCTRGQIVTFLYRDNSSEETVDRVTISRQPESGYFRDSANPSFELKTAACGGKQPYTCEWHRVYRKYSGRFDTVGKEVDEIVEGATGESCTVRQVGEYYCVVTDAIGCRTTSKRAGVGFPLEISNPPKNGVFTENQPCYLEVGVTGGAGTVSYQWDRYGREIPGATERSYAAAEEGEYRVVVEDWVGSTYVDEVIVKSAGKNDVNVLDKDDFLLYAEDCFQIVNRGPMVSGRVQNGRVDVGDKLRFMTWDPETHAYEEYVVTVEGIDRFQESAEYAEKGDNVGLLLSGITKDQMQRGSALVDADTDFQPVTGSVKGTLYVNSKDEGGRHTPLPIDSQPQFYYGNAGEVTAAFSYLGGHDSCEPGRYCGDVTVKDLARPVFWYAGQQISVREDGRVIGVFTVTEIKP